MEDWMYKYDYPMSEIFWRDAIKLHTGNDPYANNTANAELLQEMKEIKKLLRELIIEVRKIRQTKNDIQRPPENPAKKSKGVEL